MPRPLPAAVLAITDGDVDAVRNHMLEAAHRVIDKHGLAAASTRAIADEAGVAGGTLYNYFENRHQLLAKSIVHHAKNLTDPVAKLPSRAGKNTIAHNLRFFVRQSAIALDQLVPLFAAAFSDPALLHTLRREMADVDPLSDPAAVVERYLLAERDLGRISPDADCHAAASIVVSICHDDAFQRYLSGERQRPKSRHKEIEFITRSLTA
jgi:AcrR family transcriptional regulator